MSNLTQYNINFTVNNTEAIGGFATKRTHSSLIANNKYNINAKQSLIDYGYETFGGFCINATDIDWNTAELPNSNITTGGLKTITNSGELLKLIDDIQKEIYILTDIIFNKISNFYWYVGVINPSNPSNESENIGNNKWSSLSSKPESISVNTGMEMPPTFWYIAIPHSYGFQAYDSTGGAPDSAAYDKTLITINGVEYDLFIGTTKAVAVNAVFKV